MFILYQFLLCIRYLGDLRLQAQCLQSMLKMIWKLFVKSCRNFYKIRCNCWSHFGFPKASKKIIRDLAMQRITSMKDSKDECWVYIFFYCAFVTSAILYYTHNIFNQCWKCYETILKIAHTLWSNSRSLLIPFCFQKPIHKWPTLGLEINTQKTT